MMLSWWADYLHEGAPAIWVEPSTKCLRLEYPGHELIWTNIREMRRRNRRPFTTYRSTVELEFSVTDENCFLITESARVNCEIVLDEVVYQSGSTVIQFISVYDSGSPRVLSDALDCSSIADARILAEDSEASLLELVTTGPSLARTVSDSRAIARHISANRGEGRAVVEVPPSTDPQQVIDVFRDQHPDATLVVRREYDSGTRVSESLLKERILSELTDKQRESLITAYNEGYFDQPREATAAECATELGISQSTFSQHLNVALYKVLSSLLNDRSEQ